MNLVAKIISMLAELSAKAISGDCYPGDPVQAIQYPDSDSQPMADNTKQFEAIVYIKKGCDWLFLNNPNVFVAGDLLWYPVAGNNKLRQAPDAMVVFERPKGDRVSYQQWQEDNIAPLKAQLKTLMDGSQ
jgi:Uma2 family endonuclease